MKNYDAKDAWLVIDGKKVMNLNINDEQFYGLGDADKYYTKDNSKENQDRLRDNFKYAQSEPIPAKRTIEFYNIEYVQIPHKDFTRKGKWIK